MADKMFIVTVDGLAGIFDGIHQVMKRGSKVPLPALRGAELVAIGAVRPAAAAPAEKKPDEK